MHRLKEAEQRWRDLVSELAKLTQDYPPCDGRFG
ncbi:hypothetical protein MED193_10623 [Roseobacter sp. MED193]|nr:hypothetical protein MED193_10623 [Roseobacter sp. MED193]